MRAVELYRNLFETTTVVLIGDLNSSVIWDREHPAGANQSALVAQLGSLGLVSAYHAFFGEEQGKETRPTFHFWRQEGRPFHIDYCFLPVEWSNRITDVHVGEHADWKTVSDHRPLVVDVASEQVTAG